MVEDVVEIQTKAITQNYSGYFLAISFEETKKMFYFDLNDNNDDDDDVIKFTANITGCFKIQII